MMPIVNLAFLATLSTFQVIDLTHTINEDVQVWDGSCGFVSELTSDYDNSGFRGQKFTLRSCLGTHIDSPAHCIQGAQDCSTMNIENCIVPAYVIDVSAKADENYCITVEDLIIFENRYGQIQPGSLIFFSTGWSKRWDNPYSFRNEKDDGIPHFPYVSEDVAKFLLGRDIVGIGVETFSPDPFYGNAPVHKLLLGAGKYIIENVANLESMPAIGAYAIALPLKIEGGAESPIRLIGLKPINF